MNDPIRHEQFTEAHVPESWARAKAKQRWTITTALIALTAISVVFGIHAHWRAAKLQKELTEIVIERKEIADSLEKFQSDFSRRSSEQQQMVLDMIGHLQKNSDTLKEADKALTKMRRDK